MTFLLQNCHGLYEARISLLVLPAVGMLRSAAEPVAVPVCVLRLRQHLPTRRRGANRGTADIRRPRHPHR